MIGRILGKLLGVGVVVVNHRQIRMMSKELFFSQAVLGHGGVIIQMVVGEVGKNDGVKLQPPEPVLIESNRSYFHHRVLATGLDHLLQDPKQRHEIGAARPPMNESAEAARLGAGIELPDVFRRPIPHDREQPVD